MKNLFKLFTLLLISLFTVSVFYGCIAVKPYQRMYLNDPEMAMGKFKSEAFELNVLHYREGNVIIAKGKSSGGCGCN